MVKSWGFSFWFWFWSHGRRRRGERRKCYYQNLLLFLSLLLSSYSLSVPHFHATSLPVAFYNLILHLILLQPTIVQSNRILFTLNAINPGYLFIFKQINTDPFFFFSSFCKSFLKLYAKKKKYKKNLPI